MTDTIAELGTRLGPDVVGAVRALYAPEQEPRAAALAPVASDFAYGPHPRNRLDLYREGESGGLRPVLLFVHGGGFLVGDKGGDGNGNGGWANAHLGRWAAVNGMLGAVMNYRLAPDETWPAGAEDVAAAVEWLQEHAAEHGGDPERIVLLGTSAGSVHIAGFLKLRSDHAGMVRAAVLLSGLYGFTPLDERDMLYYGPQDAYAGRMPRKAVVETALPLLLACAEFDPPRFQAEWAGLLQARLDRHGRLPRAHYASGHNHYSMAMHIGTADRRLSDEILTFISAHS
ncbi:alpha/beta hydrolase [Novosphingobium sp. fls2-241-R2A-195]|uniref:alpha/beta hydrolase n=1 Tax=Novosphingobium sp. fls2-241-R2A-195 TaxID=3040296 RepID=UPI00254F43E7|nr:alpha/beta hydrolase [Novosphingobium sp. fls2-241-R2A-195]